MSKEKVMAALESKATPYGFNSEELQSVGDKITEILPEGATDEDIDKAVESYIPFLKLAQSASHRSFEKMKAQFEKEHPVPPKEDKPKEDKPKEDKPKDKPKDEEPEWFKSYREQMEAKLKEQEDKIASMKLEKTSEGLMAKAVATLKSAGVDKNFYELMLEGKTFATEDEANALVAKVKTGWETLKKERDIKDMVQVTPPKASAHPAPEKPSQAVLDRIDKRKKSKVSSAIQTGDEDSK